MAITYKLNIYSRDVDYTAGFGKHSGYQLIGYDENNNVVSIESVELVNSESGITGNSIFKFFSETTNIPNGQIIIPSQIYQNENWINTTPQWAIDNNYKSTAIDVANTENAFKNIKENATLFNNMSNYGLNLPYNALTQNCNSWAQYVSNLFLSSTDIFDLLNEATQSNDSYIGGDLSFPFLDDKASNILEALGIYQRSKAMIDNIENLQKALEKKGLDLQDVTTSTQVKLNGIYCQITTPSESFSIYTTMPICSKPQPIMTAILPLFSTAVETRSPLVVDLDGDGVETVSENNGVYFDHDGNNFAEKSGWAGKDDGLLVRDINNNGQVDDGTELFGNNSVLASGQKANNGFEALKDLDSNSDNIFNSSDAAWNEVKIWKDANQNAIVDNDEILSLEQANNDNNTPYTIIKCNSVAI